MEEKEIYKTEGELQQKHPGGRPRKWKTPEELQEAIDAYFAKCDAEKRPYTITGLAIALNTTREVLLDYENQYEQGFRDTIKKAKQKCQAYAEEQLFTNPRTAGVIFNMVNNYGWKNRQDTEISGPNSEPVKIDISSEEIARLYELVRNKENNS